MPIAKRNKHSALIRKLIGKLLKKLGQVYLTKVTPAKHHALIDYIERARRKRVNKAKKLKLMALLGKEVPKEVTRQAKDEESDSDDEMESEEDKRDDVEMEEQYSDKGESSEEQSDDESADEGGDMLATGGVDIPNVDAIPVVSKLAKEKKLEKERSKLAKIDDTKTKVKQLMQTEAEEYESHFVENPLIRMRERALQKQMDSKKRIGSKQLLATTAVEEGDDEFMDEDDAAKQDIVLVKETGKFIINDLELPSIKTKKGGNLGKRARIEGGESDEESSKGNNDSDSDTDEEDLKKKLKQVGGKRFRTNEQGSYKQAEPSEFKKKRQIKQPEGHIYFIIELFTQIGTALRIVKYSASAYKSAKGQGDTLKAGKYEPFAYIQLNPKMLNKRNKTKAVKSFEGVVSHGKKVNKRQKDEGNLLSGISFKK